MHCWPSQLVTGGVASRALSRFNLPCQACTISVWGPIIARAARERGITVVNTPGRNASAVYSPQLAGHGKQKLELESALHKALERDELRLRDITA